MRYRKEINDAAAKLLKQLEDSVNEFETARYILGQLFELGYVAGAREAPLNIDEVPRSTSEAHED